MKVLARVAAALVCTAASAQAQTMESIGAEKCGGSVKSFEIEFLAPENASVAGTAKVLVNGLAATQPNATALSIDGRPCTNARCPFEAKKGQTYKLTAISELPRVDQLCIVVARP
jgi:hypothetical protein